MTAGQTKGAFGKGGGLIFIIVYFAGVLLSLCYLFVPAKEGQILEGQNIPNLFSAFTGHVANNGTPYVQMLFGHGPDQLIGMPAVLLDILICFLPIALMLAAVVMILVRPRGILGLIFGFAASVIFLGVDLLLLLTGTACLGLYLNMAGVVIMLLGLLLFYIGREEEDEDADLVAGVVTCRTGSYAGSTFEIPGRVVIGKDPRECNIVLPNNTISRVHCIINYIPETDTYTVKDVSSNGTYFGDGRRLTKNYEMQVPRETEIYMGNPRETFYLD